MSIVFYMFRKTLVTSDLSSACTSATDRQLHDIRVSNRYPRHHRVLCILLYSSMHLLITTVVFIQLLVQVQQ